jgi:putative membrane protein
MNRIVLGVVLSAVVAIAAHAHSFSERTGINSLLGISPSTEDFISQVVLGEIFQLELVKLAEQRGNPKTKLLAAELLQDHKKTLGSLKTLIHSGAVQVVYPTALNAAYRAQLAPLQSVAGPEFDREFEKTQIAFHELTIELFERYGSGGDHPDLKRFAYNHLPHLREHRKLMRTLGQ